jgi:hypothetical protein
MTRIREGMNNHKIIHTNTEIIIKLFFRHALYLP